MTAGQVLLNLDQVTRDYPLPRRHPFGARPFVRALDRVSLDLGVGESLGIVGESGSGKSTLARAVMALERPTAGQVRFDGHDLFALPARTLRRLRPKFQMVFQDPYGSLDPRMTVERIVAEPLAALTPAPDRAKCRALVEAALVDVGLDACDRQRYPHEFSGGQRQRIAIARALVSDPRLIVADEPVSALDVSVQAQVLNLFQDLKHRHAVAYLFISHDLAVVNRVADRVAVLHHGRVVEIGPTRAVLARPVHPYTQSLIEAVPRPDPRNRRRGGRRDVETAPPTAETGIVRGCAFRTRCPMALAICAEETPALRPAGDPAHAVACHAAAAATYPEEQAV